MNPDPPSGERFDVPGDAWTNDWLDEAVDRGSEADWPGEIDRRRAADLRWLHVLLEYLHRPADAAQEARIQKVMQVVSQQVNQRQAVHAEAAGRQSAIAAAPARRPAARRWYYSSLASAAAILACLAIARLWNDGHRQASAAIAQATAQAASDVDRQYRVTRTRREADGQIVETKSILYTRGSKFAHFGAGQFGLLEEMWIGSDGEQFWTVPARPVLRALIQGALDSHGRLKILELDLSTFLQVSPEHYRLESLPAEPLKTGSEPALVCSRVRGYRKPESAVFLWLPAEFDLWIDPQTGVVRRLAGNWQPKTEQAGPLQLVLEWIGQAPQDDVWYKATGHR